MKIAAYTALHYGLDYLPYAIQSVKPFVDEWLFAYSAVGSHGHKTSIRCPEKEHQLRTAATGALGDTPYRWWSEDWPHEGAQRDSVFRYTDADLIIVVDADEIWQPDGIKAAIEHGKQMDVRMGRVPFVHFWKTFDLVCRDAATPVRVIKPSVAEGEAYLDIPPVLHFGYAQPNHLMVYKWFVHGHKNELRKEWYEKVYKYWSPDDGPFEDLHPTNIDYWTAEPFDKYDLPEFMHDHKWFKNEVIT